MQCIAGCWVRRSKAEEQSGLSVKVWEPSVFLAFAARVIDRLGQGKGYRIEKQQVSRMEPLHLKSGVC